MLHLYRSALHTFCTCFCLLALSNLHAATNKDAKDILKLLSSDKGLCLVLGSNSDCAAALAKSSKYLVHAIALKQDDYDNCKASIQKAGMQGICQVELLREKQLPYVSDLANVIIIEDSKALKSAGIKQDEIKRVLAHGGSIISKKGKTWQHEQLPWPSNVSQWTHPTCNPDGNRVVNEVISFPLGLRWQDGLPLNVGHWASNRGWVAARGLVFTISMSEYENVEKGGLWGPQQQWLHARHSANGLPAWKIPLDTKDEKSDLTPLNTAPLATNGELVFCVQKQDLVAVDALSGDIKRTFDCTLKPVRLALVDNTAICVGWENIKRLKMWDPIGTKGSSVWDLWTPSANKGSIEAFNINNGKKIWSIPEVAQTLFVSDNIVVYMQQGPAPVQKQDIVARDIKDGKELWRVSNQDIGSSANLFLAAVGEGTVALTRHKTGTDSFKLRCDQITVLSLTDGKKLWQADKHGDALVIYAKGNLWYGHHSYDPKTGSVNGKSPIRSERKMCVPPVVVGDMASSPRNHQWTDVNQKSSAFAGGIRGGCIQGVAVSEGRMYIAQNWCRCSPGQLPGFLSLSSEAMPSPQEISAKRPVVRNKIASTQNNTPQATQTSWSTFRADNARSGYADLSIGNAVKMAWSKTIAPSNEHHLSHVWKQNLHNIISAPVISGDLIISCARNNGEVIALNAKSGKTVWTASCDARIDSPPSIHKNLCLTPCHDGWLYAISLTDGSLMWRTRIAPLEKRMVSFGQIESSWPVVGSPLVHNDIIYAVAGRSTEMQGGCNVVALKENGDSIWASTIDGGPGRSVDVLRWHDNQLRMQNRSINPSDGSVKLLPDNANERKIRSNLSGLIDDTWYFVGNRRSGKYPAGQLTADCLVWNSDTWFGYSNERQNKGLFSISFADANSADPKHGPNNKYNWSKQCTDMRVTSLVITNNKLITAGKVNGKGVLRIIDITNGQSVAELALPAVPVVNGIAASAKQIIVNCYDGSSNCVQFN